MNRIDRGEQHLPSVMLAATRLLYHMGNIFRDNAPAMPTVGGIHIDRKRWAELQEQRIALGHELQIHDAQHVKRFKICAAIDKENGKLVGVQPTAQPAARNGLSLSVATPPLMRMLRL